jgi:ketopantoate reductase
MRIGILGSGLMGGTLGTLFARAGHEVTFSYSRSEQKLNRLGGAGKEGSASPGRLRVRHLAERGAVRRVRSQAQAEPTQPRVLRRR